MDAYFSSFSSPRGRAIGTPCYDACESSGAAGCAPAGSVASSDGQLTSVHILKNPTSFARVARLLANLPSSWFIEVRRG